MILNESTITLDVNRYNEQYIFKYGRIIFSTGSIIYNDFITPYLKSINKTFKDSLYTNYTKINEFLENIKKIINNYYKREFYLKFLFNFKESNEENKDSLIKNISCEYQLMNLSIIDIDMNTYQDNNIFLMIIIINF
jgi:hypothetical protein